MRVRREEEQEINWATVDLPDAWPDHWDFRRPHHLLQFIWRVIRPKYQTVQLPDGLPGADAIPKYVLQEFHNLPNGNYSKQITRGYATGFDTVMLGRMKRARATLASSLGGFTRVLDLGCAGGKQTAELQAVGVSDVWGLDPSPYLLQHAAVDFPGAHFVHGVAEATGFDEGSFDGVTACFLFHELPPKYSGRAVAEISRVLKPGGRVAICEPSPLQIELSSVELVRRFGLSALYFALLARFVHEPFLQAWRAWDMAGAFTDAGFNILSSDDDFPFRYLIAEKR